jgi:hypothetical protein
LSIFPPIQNVLLGHRVHSVPAVSVTYPARHMQSVIIVLPVADVVSTGHTVHSCVPKMDLYVPTSHALHLIPSNIALYPALHIQSLIIVLPRGELVPIGQFEQFPIPGNGLYLPVSHSMHSTPSDSDVCPDLQRHSSINGLALRESVPGGHDRHCSGFCAPICTPAAKLILPPPMTHP